MLSRQPGSSWDSLSRSSLERERFQGPALEAGSSDSLTHSCRVPRAFLHTSDPPNSSPGTWGLAPTEEKCLEVTDRVVLLCTLSAAKGKKMSSPKPQFGSGNLNECSTERGLGIP